VKIKNEIGHEIEPVGRRESPHIRQPGKPALPESRLILTNSNQFLRANNKEPFFQPVGIGSIVT